MRLGWVDPPTAKLTVAPGDTTEAKLPTVLVFAPVCQEGTPNDANENDTDLLVPSIALVNLLNRFVQHRPSIFALYLYYFLSHNH